MRRRILAVSLLSLAIAALLIGWTLGHTGSAAERGAAAGALSLRGAFGATLPVTMTLRRTGDALTGEYFYEKRTAAYVPDAREMVGRRAPDGRVTLRETDDGGSETGTLRGSLSADRFAGDWTSPDGRRRVPFSLVLFHPEAGANGERIVRQSAESSGTKPRYTIATEWPKLIGPEGRADASMAAFNEQARRTVRAADADFRAIMRDVADEGSPPSPAPTYAQETTFRVASLTPRAVSVSFEVYADTGGAHPNTNTTTLNFDRRTGRALRLRDLFALGSDYRRFLSAQCRSALHDDFQREEGLKDVPFPEGVTPDEKNFAHWTLAPQGLVIHFDRYQVAAYAEGSRDVILPWPLLKPHLRPDSPATPLLLAAGSS